MFEPAFNLKDAQITIVGLGLMGGSLAMALKENQICHKVVGLVRRAATVQEAEAQNIVDYATTDPKRALSEADIIIFATPVQIIIQQMSQFLPYYKPGAVITDLGSTKQAIVQAMMNLPDTLYPIGSHPMCGKESTGLAVAEATLYHNAPWIIVPLAQTPPPVIQLIETLARAVGAKPRQIASERHDMLVAAISHLPYTLAATLILAVQDIAQEDAAVWEITASGFKDTSRVAASDVTMMLDIFLTNREAIIQMLNLARQHMDEFAEALTTNDQQALQKLMEQAAQQRRILYH